MITSMFFHIQPPALSILNHSCHLNHFLSWIFKFKIYFLLNKLSTWRWDFSFNWVNLHCKYWENCLFSKINRESNYTQNAVKMNIRNIISENFLHPNHWQMLIWMLARLVLIWFKITRFSYHKALIKMIDLITSAQITRTHVISLSKANLPERTTEIC